VPLNDHPDHALNETLTHTPYDGSSQPFTIGLKPLDPHEWIEIDGDLENYLAEKDRLYGTLPEKVFVEEADTGEAQREILDALVAYLPERFPETYRRIGDAIEIPALGRRIALNAAETPPLRTASLLVPEDLILMRKGDNGWRLAAGSLCFPSSWSLTEKFGKPLHDIHEPVPGFGPGTRPAELIERMFDRLQGQAVERFNWSLQAGDALYHPISQRQRIDRATMQPSKFSEDEIAAQAFIRVERQTLRKLPKSQDILFTIRIYLNPLSMLGKHPERATLAASFAGQLAGLEQAQLDYKGLSADRDRLVAVLSQMAGAS
jgi:hypothetical protein